MVGDLHLVVVQPCSCKSVFNLAPVSRYLNAHTHHSAQASLCPLDTADHLFATLENSLLRSGPCLAGVPVRQTEFRPNSSPCVKHPNLKKMFALRSIGFLTPNMPIAVSLPQALLQSLCPGLSWKMAARKHREIHDVEQTKKMARSRLEICAERNTALTHPAQS